MDLTDLLLNFSGWMTLLLCAVPALLIGLLWFRRQKGAEEQFQSASWFLEKAGFQRIGVFEKLAKRLAPTTFYKSPNGRILVSLESVSSDSRQPPTHWIEFGVFVDHPPRFAIYTPLNEVIRQVNSLLYDETWGGRDLGWLQPLGLNIQCDRRQESLLRRQFSAEALAKVCEPLLQAKQPFYVVSLSTYYLRLGFAYSSLQTSQFNRWLQFVQQFCALCRAAE